MALHVGTGGSQYWNAWLSLMERVALKAWNTQMKEMPSFSIKDVKIEHVYIDEDPPLEWQEEEPGAPLSDEELKNFFMVTQKPI